MKRFALAAEAAAQCAASIEDGTCAGYAGRVCSRVP